MQWTNLTCVEPPASTPIDLDTAKAHLNVSHTDDDDLIERLIEAAVSFVEGPHGAGVALLTQTWRQSFGPRDDLRIGLYPVAEILTVEIDGEARESFTADLDQSPVAIRLMVSSKALVRVTFRAGFGDDPADVPASLRQALLLIVAHFYAHRGDAEAEMPRAVTALLDRYRPAI